MKKDFYLIETILWQADSRYGRAEFSLLERHLERLERSAAFFDFPYSGRLISKILADLSSRLSERAGKKMQRFRVRCTLDASGTFAITDVDEFLQVPVPVKVDISPIIVDPDDIFLYHKTSRREFFDRERGRLQGNGCFDTVLLNNRGEITQGTITNIFLDLGQGELVTPAVACGLLPGTLRQELIEKRQVQEAVIYKENLKAVNGFFMGNSLRGLIPAKFDAISFDF